MGIVASILLVLAGVFIIGFTLTSAFRTVVLPRAAFDPTTRAIFLSFRRLLLGISGISRGRIGRETVLAVHAPVGLLALAFAWAIGVILGFSLIYPATGQIEWGRALVLSGSSFTTLGFASPLAPIHEALAILEAIVGLGVVALLIAYLPTIYGLFSRREVIVADVAIKSGGVAHGPDLIRRLARQDDLERLDEMWKDWEHWFISLGETHTSEPSLTFFRSPRPDRSWLTTAGAVLDAAVLRNSVIDAKFSGRADLAYRAGLEAIESIGGFFGIHREPADASIEITRADFDAVLEAMAAEDIPIEADRDKAWAYFVAGRATYEPYLLDLCRLISRRRRRGRLR